MQALTHMQTSSAAKILYLKQIFSAAKVLTDILNSSDTISGRHLQQQNTSSSRYSQQHKHYLRQTSSAAKTLFQKKAVDISI